ncbi:hypothetical protein FA95DRAFT_1585087 [Auriscalpium vulgare]|uniref:Uncharacterized protein n=1 Tax=Auriscalpium vulgare TaxID=40419 RepID=A0ACB8R813_9AGAM|nr:hypothetical protein FA95DRAFT_1585087 [Auriscalpium vulgare]
MKLTSTFAALCVLATSSLVSAGPLLTRKVVVMNDSAKQNANFSQGAVYFITNEPSGNFVVSADIKQDGTLNLARAITTNGRGQHGDDGGVNGPDGLFSQGAVKASASGKVLAAVNPGSNTVSLFKINADNPSELTHFGTPVSSEGEFPMSLAFNSKGDQLCVLNGGQINGVSCYKIDSNLGLVAQNNTVRQLNLNQTTPANGPAGSASHIIFTEDGKNLVAAIKGNPGPPANPGFLAVWQVQTDGTLSEFFKKVEPSSGGLLPFGMSIIPGKNAILATDAALGADVFDFGQQPQADSSSGGNNSNAKGTSTLKIDGQGATCWATFSKQSGNFYVTDIKTSTVTEINVNDQLNATIVKQYPLKNDSATIDLDAASVNGKDFLYVLQPNSTSIQVLSVNAPGKASELQNIDIAGPASAAKLTISKANLQGMTTFVKA